MTPFTKELIRVLESIPPGCVITYGQAARMAGNPRAARQVARVLHSMSAKYNLPWHRVVNAKGEIAISDDLLKNEQKRRLEEEGVSFTADGRVDLMKAK